MTEGFHPKPRMNFPSALAVGIAGLDEVVEIELSAAWSAEQLRAALAPHASARLVGRDRSKSCRPSAARRRRSKSNSRRLCPPSGNRLRRSESTGSSRSRRIRSSARAPGAADLRPLIAGAGDSARACCRCGCGWIDEGAPARGKCSPRWDSTTSKHEGVNPDATRVEVAAMDHVIARAMPRPTHRGSLSLPNQKAFDMKQEMLINVSQPEECRIAIVEDGVLEELYIERTSQDNYVGNIYKGKVVNIEPSIQAAFVDFGVGRNGFLHISDIEPQYFRQGGYDPDKPIESAAAPARSRARPRDGGRG